MKYLIGAICAIVITMAFSGRKCEHVFTQVEQAAIKIERQNLYGGVTLLPYSWPSGIQEGKELICVKCFQVQKQVLDYGQPAVQSEWPYGNIYDCIDTALIHGLMPSVSLGRSSLVLGKINDSCHAIGW